VTLPALVLVHGNTHADVSNSQDLTIDEIGRLDSELTGLGGDLRGRRDLRTLLTADRTDSVVGDIEDAGSTMSSPPAIRRVGAWSCLVTMLGAVSTCPIVRRLPN
jgi:hypothetical protein